MLGSRGLLGRANDKSWFCKSCGKASLIKQEMSRHIEAYHIENHPGVKCDICGMISKTRHALIVHTTRKHKTNNSQDFYVNWNVYGMISMYFLFFLDLLSQLDARINSLMAKGEDRGWYCSVCGKTARDKQKLGDGTITSIGFSYLWRSSNQNPAYLWT